MDISTRRQALALTREIYGAQNQTAILSESPSGCEPESIRTAHEIKFLLDEMQSKSVLGWATDNLTPDAHADPLSRSYRVTSLYFDTRDWSVYYRRGFHKRHKYRVRRYGTEAFGFLERKSRWGSWVSKRRVGIPLSDLNELAQTNPRVEWPGYWFHN